MKSLLTLLRLLHMVWAREEQVPGPLLLVLRQLINDRSSEPACRTRVVERSWVKTDGLGRELLLVVRRLKMTGWGSLQRVGETERSRGGQTAGCEVGGDESSAAEAQHQLADASFGQRVHFKWQDGTATWHPAWHGFPHAPPGCRLKRACAALVGSPHPLGPLWVSLAPCCWAGAPATAGKLVMPCSLMLPHGTTGVAQHERR